jgi:hypothetical protein
LGKRAGALALHNSSCTWSISKMFYKYWVNGDVRPWRLESLLRMEAQSLKLGSELTRKSLCIIITHWICVGSNQPKNIHFWSTRI